MVACCCRWEQLLVRFLFHRRPFNPHPSQHFTLLLLSSIRTLDGTYTWNLPSDVADYTVTYILPCRRHERSLTTCLVNRFYSGLLKRTSERRRSGNSWLSDDCRITRHALRVWGVCIILWQKCTGVCSRCNGDLNEIYAACRVEEGRVTTSNCLYQKQESRFRQFVQ